MLQPVDPHKGNGRLLLDLANRGRKVALGMFNSTPRVPDPTTAEDFGNGFLMRRGYTVAWVSWQADVPRRDGLMALDVPRAQGVSGFVRCRLRPNVSAATLALADRYHLPNPTIDLDDPQAWITVREHGGAAAVTAPRIFVTNTSAEYWRGDASLIHTDATGTRDAEPAEFVRTYLFAGTQHTPGAIPPPAADANTGGRGQHRFNIVDYAPLMRAALVNLDRWVSEGVEPPASAFPRLAEGTAVEAESLERFFRSLPGVSFPSRMVRHTPLDFGPDIERGIAAYPPKAGAPYKTYIERAGRRWDFLHA